MTDSHQFFNLAALIIPVLLLGGAVSQTWTPTLPKTRPKVFFLTVAVWGTMLFAIVTEVIAIIAAVGGEPHDPERYVVGVAVVAGSVAAAGAILWPWLEALTPLRDANPEGLNPAQRKQRRADNLWRYAAISIGVVVGLVLTTILLINTSVTGSGSQLKRIEDEMLNLAKAQKQSAARLGEFAKENSATQRTLRQTIGALVAEMARIRAENERR
jgi:MFS family permease